jgi:magnesium chelatase family protein
MPHPNSSTQGVLGGGNPVLPGEAALAHRGALFLDEGLEFNRPVLQGLREPMEKHQIRLSRAGRRFWYPAAFQLLFATNPCPCGMLGREDRVCLCSVHEVERYWKRLGGPLLDRIDLRIYVAPEGDISARGETSAQIQARVYAARVMSYRRNSGRPNADLTGQEALDAAALQPSTNELLTRVVRSFGFSARAAVSLLRVARTIADLEQETSITESHLLEAVAYRRLGEENPPWEPPL